MNSLRSKEAIKCLSSLCKSFDAPLGVTLRLGWSETNATSSVGMGFTWWSGGDGLKTSIGTAYDMVAANDGTTNDANLSVVVGFGF